MYHKSYPQSGELPALPRRLKLRTASHILPRRYHVYRVLPAVFSTPRRFLPDEFRSVPAPPSPCDTLLPPPEVNARRGNRHCDTREYQSAYTNCGDIRIIGSSCTVLDRCAVSETRKKQDRDDICEAL